MCRVQLRDFENQPPGAGTYDAEVSQAESPTASCALDGVEQAVVTVKVSEDGSTALRLQQGARWPEGCAGQRTLLLTF